MSSPSSAPRRALWTAACDGVLLEPSTPLIGDVGPRTEGGRGAGDGALERLPATDRELDLDLHLRPASHPRFGDLGHVAVERDDGHVARGGLLPQRIVALDERRAAHGLRPRSEPP